MFNNGKQEQGSPEDLIVTPETVTTAGAITYWRLSGAITLDALAAAWKVEGLDEKLLPGAPSDEVAFRRAVKALEEKRVLIRPLARRGKWAVVRETVREGQSAPDYSTRIAISFEKEAMRVDAVDAGAYEAEELRAKVREAFDTQRGLLHQIDIASWLVKLAEKQNAVSLRDSGGVYFVPRPAMDFWRKATHAIEFATGGKVFIIPAMKNSEAIDAITDALTIEGDKFAEAVMSELTETDADAKLGDRALASRADACRSLLKKVESYEGFLGIKLDLVRDRVNKLNASIAAAALLVGQEDEAN